VLDNLSSELAEIPANIAVSKVLLYNDSTHYERSEKVQHFYDGGQTVSLFAFRAFDAANADADQLDAPSACRKSAVYRTRLKDVQADLDKNVYGKEAEDVLNCLKTVPTGLRLEVTYDFDFARDCAIDCEKMLLASLHSNETVCARLISSQLRPESDIPSQPSSSSESDQDENDHIASEGEAVRDTPAVLVVDSILVWSRACRLVQACNKVINFLWSNAANGLVDYGTLILIGVLESFCYEVFAGRLAALGNAEKRYRSLFFKLKLGYHFLVNGVRCLPPNFDFHDVTFNLPASDLKAVFEQVFIPCLRQFDNNILMRIGERASEIMIFQMKLSECMKCQRLNRPLRAHLAVVARYLLQVFRCDLANRLLRSQISSPANNVEYAPDQLFKESVFTTCMEAAIAQTSIVVDGFIDVKHYAESLFKRKSDLFTHVPSYCLFSSMLELLYRSLDISEENFAELISTEMNRDSRMEIVPCIGSENFRLLKRWGRLVQITTDDREIIDPFKGRILEFASHTARKRRQVAGDDSKMIGDVNSSRESLLYQCLRSEVMKKLAASGSASVSGAWRIEETDPAIQSLLRVCADAPRFLLLNRLPHGVDPHDGVLAVTLFFVAVQSFPQWNRNLSTGVLKLVRKTLFVQTGFYERGFSWRDACEAWVESRINKSFLLFEVYQGTLKLCAGSRDWSFIEGWVSRN
jgi:hypothetical protein